MKAAVFLSALAGIASLAAPALAATDASGCPLPGTALYFGNGIMTQYDEAQEIADDVLPGLATEASITDVANIGVAYNHTDGFFADIIETLLQKQAEDPRFGWFLLNNITSYSLRGLDAAGVLDLPPGASDLIAAIQALINQGLLNSVTQIGTFYDSDVADQVAGYEQDLQNDNRVIVVAHSQGNLYANAARAVLASSGPALLTSFGIDGVADPAEISFNGYVTSDTDVVINALRTLGRTVLPANVHVPFTFADVLGHGFVDVYADAGRPARAKVVAVMSSIAGTLVYPPPPPIDCLPDPPASSASSIGDPHLLTFDHLRYDLQAVGELTLAGDPTDGTEIQVRTHPWGTRTDVAINGAVAARVGSDVIAFYGSESVRLNHVVTTLPEGKTHLSGGDIHKAGSSYVVVWPDNTQLRIDVSQIYVALTFHAAAGRQGHLTGLLGNFDGDSTNDLATRQGVVVMPPVPFATLYQVYAESWRIAQADSLFDYGAGETTETFTDRSFPRRFASTAGLSASDSQAALAVCTAANVSATWLDACVLDVALTGDPSFADGAAAAPSPPATTVDVRPPLPPTIDAVFPQSIAAGQDVTITGSNLTALFGDSSETSVTLVGPVAGGTATALLPVISGSPGQITVSTPANLAALLPGANHLFVTTPFGAAQSPTTIVVTSGGGFGGGGGSGGLVGAVYRLIRGTGLFPTTGDLYSLTAPCANSTVAPAAGEACPLTTIEAANLDVPSRSFTQGFPGVDPNLNEYFAIRFRGYLIVSTAGTYRMESCSDDGSNVYLAPATDPPPGSTASPPALTKVVANDGLHAMSCAAGAVTFPAPGAYRLIVDYLQGPGSGIGLQLFGPRRTAPARSSPLPIWSRSCRPRNSTKSAATFADPSVRFFSYLARNQDRSAQASGARHDRRQRDVHL